MGPLVLPRIRLIQGILRLLDRQLGVLHHLEPILVLLHFINDFAKDLGFALLHQFLVIIIGL